METSIDGLEFIAAEEGFVGHVYEDFAGKKTIGFGHLLKEGEVFTTITRDEGLEMLRDDVGVAESHVNTHVTVELTQAQFDALVSFTFNLGGGALAKSTLLRKLNAGDFDGASVEFLRWCKATINGSLQTSPTLLKRRTREMKMFKGDELVT